MALDNDWFRYNVKALQTAGEDKELEMLLLKDRIYIEYLEDLYWRKVQKKRAFRISAEGGLHHRLVRLLNAPFPKGILYR